MSRIYEEKIQRWDGGITQDTRDPRSNVGVAITNFDILSNYRKMTPYRSSEDGDSDGTNSKKANFCTAFIGTSTITTRLFALGVQTAQPTRAEILYKSTGTSSTNDMSDNGWANTGAHQAASGATNFNLFVFYRYTTANNSRIFGASGGNRIWSYDPTGSAAFDDAGRNITYTNIAQGLVHSKDDILYIPYDNKIAKNNQGSWTDAALTLPEHLYITSICEYGNFIAILASPLADRDTIASNGEINRSYGNSRIFLWDRDATLTTLSEAIDAGSGHGKIIETVDGELICISIYKGSIKDKIIFRRLIGTHMEKFLELTSVQSTTTQLSIRKQKIDNRLYFLMAFSIPLVSGTMRAGLWSIGRLPGTPFILNHERTFSNDTAFTSSDTLRGFLIFEDFTFIAYDLSGTYDVSKTDNASSYSHTAIYESKIFDGGDSSIQKKLVGVTIQHEFLPSSTTITVKYRKDEETSFTTIFTSTTADAISASAINIASSGATLPRFKEIQFRIEVTGGNGEITGFSYAAEEVDDRPYASLVAFLKSTFRRS
jgi:hypothetical protein